MSEPDPLSCTVRSCTDLNGREEISPTESAEIEPSGGELVAIDAKRDLDESFERFWTAYPRKEGSKPSARKRWARLTTEQRTLCVGVAEVMAELVRRGAQDRRFIPYPTTFLNGERWEDWREGIPAGWLDEASQRKAANDASIEAAVQAMAAGYDPGRYEP